MSLFFEEVCQQPKAIRDTIKHNQESCLKSSKPFLITGMGSSLAASELFASYLNLNNLKATAIDNSEILQYVKQELIDQHELIIVSQSGESYEAKQLATLISSVTAITNSPNSSLVQLSERAFFTYAGKESAIASSKSFTTTIALMLMLAEKLTGNKIKEDLLRSADAVENMLKHSESIKNLVGKWINPTKPLILLGRGPSVITARQASLTLKETARIFAEGMSFPQFRHGPFELLEEKPQIIFFNPKGITYEISKTYVEEIADRGAKVLYIADEKLEHSNIKSIEVDSVSEYVSVIPFSLVIQLAAIALSEKRGLVAGEAKVITKITDKQ